jgi:hypothetical protein
VDVELRVIPDCPNAQGAFDLLRLALRDLGFAGVAIRVTIVEDDSQAQLLGFAGSPTFVADGHDLFPDNSLVPAWSCRLYPGSSGPSRLPALRELTAALHTVANDREIEPSESTVDK